MLWYGVLFSAHALIIPDSPDLSIYFFTHKVKTRQCLTEQGARFDILCGMPKPDDANVYAAVHEANQRILEKGRELGTRGRSSLYAL